MLTLARSLFQEQMSLERLVSTIITEAKELLKCERCTVYLLDLKLYDQVNSKVSQNMGRNFKFLKRMFQRCQINSMEVSYLIKTIVCIDILYTAFQRLHAILKYEQVEVIKMFLIKSISHARFRKVSNDLPCQNKLHLSRD